MSKRQQRRRASRRHAHAMVAGGGLAVVATLSTGGVAQAANTFTVTNLNDLGMGSLRAAILAVNADATDTAAPGDAIVFASGLSGTINLTSGELDLTRPVQITGPGANKLAIHAAPSSRILYIGYSTPTTISGITLTGGDPLFSSHQGAGGAILAESGVTLSSVIISGNTAISGGGIDDFRGTTLSVNDSTISGNIASSLGGGVYAYDGVAINNSTISGNTAPTGAGVRSYDPTSIVGSTIVGNAPTGAGGQVAMKDVSHPYLLTLHDSIVAGDGSTPDVVLPSLATQSVSFSLVRNPASAGAGDQAISTDATDITNKDPLLGSLAFNGGPTQTMVPLASSPVLDQGKAFGLTTDQRGLSRPFALPIASVPVGGDRSDIGAVEVHSPAVSGLLPSSGGAGTHVTIGGTGFTGATKVLFGQTPASSFTVLGDGTIIAVAPPYNGVADVRVIGPFGESPIVAADRFTFPTFTPTVKPKHPRGKLKGHKLSTGEKVGCPTGGPSCRFTFKVLDHKLKLGKGTFSLGAGGSKTLKLKLKNTTLKKLGHHKKFKIKLTIIATDGTGTPITFKKTITVKE